MSLSQYRLGYKTILPDLTTEYHSVDLLSPDTFTLTDEQSIRLALDMYAPHFVDEIGYIYNVITKTIVDVKSDPDEEYLISLLEFA